MRTGIGGCSHDLVMFLKDMAPKFFHARLVSFAQSFVQAYIGVELTPYRVVSSQAQYLSIVGIHVLNKFDLTPSSHCTGFEALAHLGHQAVEASECRAAHLPVSLRLCRNDIRHLGCVEEGTVNPLVWLYLLTKNGDVVVRRNEGVQRVDSIPRVVPCVSGFARELAVDLLSSVHQDSAYAVGDDSWEHLPGSRVSARR